VSCASEVSTTNIAADFTTKVEIPKAVRANMEAVTHFDHIAREGRFFAFVTIFCGKATRAIIVALKLSTEFFTGSIAT
jgi:hypothetical protein